VFILASTCIIAKSSNSLKQYLEEQEAGRRETAPKATTANSAVFAWTVKLTPESAYIKHCLSFSEVLV